MYRMYREIQNLNQNLSLKLSQNFSLSESSRMTPGVHIIFMQKIGWQRGKLIYLGLSKFEYYKVLIPCIKVDKVGNTTSSGGIFDKSGLILSSSP